VRNLSGSVKHSALDRVRPRDMRHVVPELDVQGAAVRGDRGSGDDALMSIESIAAA